MKINLVQDWKKFYTWYSIQAKIAVTAILLGWNQLPTDLKSSLPESTAKYIAIGILIFGCFGTIIDQSKVKNDSTDTPAS